MDDFKINLRLKKEKLYRKTPVEESAGSKDQFYFCDFSAKKKVDKNENQMIVDMLEELKRKGRQLKEAQAKGVFKKKRVPAVEELESIQQKNIMIDSIDSESDELKTGRKRVQEMIGRKVTRGKEKKIMYKKKAVANSRPHMHSKGKNSSRSKGKNKIKKQHRQGGQYQSKTSNNTQKDSKSATSNSNISNKVSKSKRGVINFKGNEGDKFKRGLERFSSVPKGEFLRTGSKVKDKRPRKQSFKKGKGKVKAKAKGKEHQYRRKEAVSLKKFLEKKKSRRNLIKVHKGYQTEIRKSSMMKEKRRMDNSLRKYLPKGFKKLKGAGYHLDSKGFKKKISDPRAVKSKADNSLPSADDIITHRNSKGHYIMKKHKVNRGAGNIKGNLQHTAKSLRAVKFENLLTKPVQSKKDSTYKSMAKAPKNSLLGPRSLPKINTSHKNFFRVSEKGIAPRLDFKPHFSKVANTEYDYLNSQRDTAGGTSGFEGSRLSHGSMISNNLRKKMALPPRSGKSNLNKKKRKIGTHASKKGKRVEYAMKPRKHGKKRQSQHGKGRGNVNGLPRGAFKAITAKKKPRTDWKGAFSKDNPHLRTAPEMMRKSTPKSKLGLKNVINRHRKQLPFGDSGHMISTHNKKSKAKFSTNYSHNPQTKTKNRSGTQKKPRQDPWVQMPGWYHGAPGQRIKTPRDEDGLGVFDFSNKPHHEKVFDTGNSFEHMNRFYNNAGSRKNISNKHFSSSSVNKKVNKGYEAAKLMGRHSAINTPLTRFSTLEINQPRVSKVSRPGKMTKPPSKYTSKYKSKSPKNLTLDKAGPGGKYGKYKSKLLRNLTEKQTSSQRVLFDGGVGQKMTRAASKPLKTQNSKGTFDRRDQQFRQKQNVYNHIRLGDSNVSNKFIINLGQAKGKHSAKGRVTRFRQNY